MVARDLSTGNVTSPVNYVENPDYDKDDGSPKFLPAEPHIGTTVNVEEREQTVQTGFARGGTTNPPKGVSGDVEQLDNDGKVVDVHPGEIARIVQKEGSQAGLKKLGGSPAPAGEPQPEAATSSSKKK